MPQNVAALLRRVIAEDADHLRAEELRQLDGNLEAIEMLLPRLVDLHLPDRRADGRDADPAAGELRFDLLPKRAIEVKHVDLVGAAQLDMRDTVFPAAADLLIQVGRN